MSLTTGLNAGTSGLLASSQELGVIGDNIANANTIGFKKGRAAFQEALAQSMLGAGGIGGGTRLEAVQRIVSGGALVATGVPTDLAVDGDGFFVVRGSHSGMQGTWYTRDGRMRVDADGYLSTAEGLRVEGWSATGDAIAGGPPGDLRVGSATAPPQATARVTVRANLQADATPPSAAWDAANAAATSNFSTGTVVYDSLGVAHQVDVYFRKDADGSWSWHALAAGAGTGAAGTRTEIAAGTLRFDTAGRLSSSTQTGTFNPTGAAQPQALAFDFGTAGAGDGSVTQFAAPSAAAFVGQDGWPSGDLAALRFEPDGRITATFTNGRERVVGRVALARFAAPDRLARDGGNLLGATSDSGAPAIGGADEGGRGSLVSGSLEQSNVDLAEEFVRMIAAQRGFEANSKTITTADQLLSELIALKR